MEGGWSGWCARRWRELPERESGRRGEGPLRSDDEAILQQLCEQSSTQKHPRAELDFKQQGNARFKVKDYTQAVALYSKGLRHSSAGSSQAALLYANRSAALYHLQRYQDCLDDVRRAQELGYPPELEHKILARRTSCLHHLGILEGASNSQTRGSLSGGDGQSSAATALSSIEPFSKSCGTPSSQREASTVPWEVSPAIVLHSDALRGRHFVATEELKPGEVVLQEEAFAAVLIPEGRGRQSGPNEDLYCHHCLGQAELPLPCLSCSFSSYCSELCRQRAWNQCHWFECRLGGLLLALGTFAHLALRTVVVAGMQEVERAERLGSGGDRWPSEEQNEGEAPNHMTRQRRCSGTKGFQGTSDRMSRDSPSRYLRIHSLLTHTKRQNPKNRFLCGMTAAAVCWGIRQRGLEPQLVSKGMEVESAQGQRLSTLRSALLRHMLQLQCNAQAITAVRDTGGGNSHVAEMEQVRIATAFYSAVSLLNHSCQPNTSITFHNTTMTVRASQRIPATQEVLHCYGNPNGQTPPSLAPTRIPPCLSHLTRRKDIAAVQTAPVVTWSPNRHSFKQVQLLRTKIDIARRLSARNPDEAFQLLSKCQRLAQSLLTNQHPVQGEIEDCLAQIYAAQADWPAAAGHLRRSCELVRVQFGDGSLELGKELFKLAQTLFNGQVVDEALSVIEQAESLFSLHCGGEHEMMIELSEMKSCLQPLVSQFPVTPQSAPHTD
ncbi:LOW QUALITY PROTEIN: SET and MYND domain-containing protein 4 [Scyliorhinus torazame]|uniref:LOW QUALITY PROTEIN: SET and MYND domain-containing protein 4 n=1 Tax=Scyliorhinus torazame TaxID=75743 RepID=UPI003B5C9092